MASGVHGIQPALGEIVSRDLTLQQVAASIDLDASHLGKLLRGHYRPSWSTALALSDLLGRPVEALFSVEPFGTREVVG